jgi:peptidyl-tRNA hydrolase, PTH1 family
MKIILGLGNPGKRYQNNRHNIGFMVIDKLADEFSVKLRRSIRANASLAKKIIKGEDVILVKPLTFMNNSGAAIKKVIDIHKVDKSDILVIYDDVDLNLGELRFRRSGSAGGHRGMASVIERLGADNINRLRIGIARPSSEEVADYVLSDFAFNEEPIVITTIEESAKASIDWVASGIEAVMSAYNIRKNR